MQGLGARQASIDYHLEMARRCLALSGSQRLLLNDDPHQSDEAVEQPRHGSRIAAKIIHLQNLIAALTPVPATTEANQSSVFNRFRSSVETLWNDRREHHARDQIKSQPRFVQVHLDLPTSHPSLDFSSTATSRHRRAGSSRI